MGIQLEKNIQRLAVNIMAGIIDIGNNQCVVVALIMIQHDTRHTLYTHGSGARNLVMLIGRSSH